jgi:hypothetical protein
VSAVEDLRAVVVLLELAYEDAKERLAEDEYITDPLVAKTMDGRYILLDSLTELVRARTVLAQLEKT